MIETTIYTIGGGEIFSLIFNGIASLISGAEGHKGIFFNPFVRIGAITGLLVAIVQTMWRDQMEIIRSFFIPFIVMLFVVLTPTTTVHIIDNLSARKDYVVAHVPFGLGFVAGLFSQIGQEITEKIEQVFSLPDDLKYHKTGAVFASNLIKNSRIFHIVDENVAENMRGFVTQCVVYDALLGRKYTFQDLKNTDDIWALVTKEPSPVRAFLWQEFGKKSEIVTCEAGAQKLEKLFKGEIDKTADFFGKKLFRTGDNTPISFKAEIYKYLPVSFSYLVDSSKNAQEIIKQQIMIHSVLDGIENKSVALGNAPNVALRKAYLQQRNTNASLGQLAADTLPVMKILLEAIIYVAFLVVFPLVLMPWGWKVFKAWLELVVWIHCWAPLYAVLNMIMTVYGRSQSLSLTALENGHGVTIANSVGLMDFHADLSAMAGWAAISIPFLAGALVKGGVSAFNTLATHLGGVSQSVASRAGDELTSGNYSLGNVSLGTVQANNTNMNQHMLSGSWHSGAFTQSDGRIQEITTASGAQILDEKISSLASNMNISESMQSMFQKQAARSEAAAHTSIVAANQQEAKAYRDMIDYARHQATNKNVANGYSEATHGSFGKSLSTLNNKVEEFAKQQNIGFNEAAQLLAEASAGIGGSNIGLSIKGNIQSGAQKNKIYQAAEQYAKNHNLTDTLSSIAQATRESRFGTQDDIGQRYSDNISSSLEKADQLRREASASLQRSHSFSLSATESTQQSWNITDNANQEYFEWLSSQSYMGTPGAMGTSQAKHIVINNPTMNRAYQREFMHQRQAELDNHFDRIDIKSTDDIRRGYEAYQSSIKEPEDLKNHDQTVVTRAYETGFKEYQDNTLNAAEELLVNQVEQKLQDYNSEIQKGALSLEDFGKRHSDNVQNQKEKSLTSASLEQVRESANTLWEDAKGYLKNHSRND